MIRPSKACSYMEVSARTTAPAIPRLKLDLTSKPFQSSLGDPQPIARYELEAQVLAWLDPNIAARYTDQVRLGLPREARHYARHDGSRSFNLGAFRRERLRAAASQGVYGASWSAYRNRA